MTGSINRKGIKCLEIDREAFEVQRKGCEKIDSSDQLGYTEIHYANDDYDLYVFVGNGVRYRFYSNRDS